MSFHKSPKYQIPELIADLQSHRLEHDKPNQLADAFRAGWLAAWNRRAAQSEKLPSAIPTSGQAQPVSAGLTDAGIRAVWDRMDWPTCTAIDFARALLSAAQQNSQPSTIRDSRTVQFDSTSADARDAARYRWARTCENGNALYCIVSGGECGGNMDAAIDAAIAASREKP